DEAESQITSKLTQQASARSAKDQDRRAAVEAGSSLWPVLVGLVLALLAIELFVAFRVGVAFYPIVVRGCAFAALALALLNPKIFSATKALDVVLAVDLSRSVGQEGGGKAPDLPQTASRLKKQQTAPGSGVIGR